MNKSRTQKIKAPPLIVAEKDWICGGGQGGGMVLTLKNSGKFNFDICNSICSFS